MRKPVLAFAAGLAFASALAAPAHTQESITLDKLADIQSGAYLAGDNVKFTLVAHDDDFLLRFDNDPEVYVLYSDRASLGGRLLKYDYGGTAIQVSGWGGITLYTDAKPNGLPAVRTGDAAPIAPAAVSLAQMQNTAGDEADALGYTRRLPLNITADWNTLAGDPNARAFGYDTMENAVRGIVRYTATPACRQAFAQHIATLQIAEGSHPYIALEGKTLMVTFNPARGYEGRASSRAIAKALGGLLKVPAKG